MVRITRCPHRADGNDDGLAWDHCRGGAAGVLLPGEREEGKTSHGRANRSAESAPGSPKESGGGQALDDNADWLLSHYIEIKHRKVRRIPTRAKLSCEICLIDP